MKNPETSAKKEFPSLQNYQIIKVLSLDVKRQKVPNITKTIYNYQNVDNDALITYIKNIDFEIEVFCNDVLKQIDFFSQKYLLQPLISLFQRKRCMYNLIPRPCLILTLV